MQSIVGKKVLVAGANGMVGRALVRQLEQIDCQIIKATRKAADFTDSQAASTYIDSIKPDVVLIVAAKVGGIYANDTYPAQFIYDNLMIAANIIHASYHSGVHDLIFLGSSCIYPKFADQPIKEEYLLTGTLEPTNEWYAIAKIAGIKLCDAYNKQYGVNYFSAMPNNLYGIADNYHPDNSHVIPGLIRRFHEAKLANAEQVVCWGTGKPLREFLYADDLAKGVMHLIDIRDKREHSLYNIGYGSDVTIKELAGKVASTVGFTGEIVFDASKPDGTPRKLMDSSRVMVTGWKPEVGLDEGLKLAYEWYLDNIIR
jgi:GDP-L-fucose synthase